MLPIYHLFIRHSTVGIRSLVLEMQRESLYLECLDLGAVPHVLKYE
jgi:hypothetical protein